MPCGVADGRTTLEPATVHNVTHTTPTPKTVPATPPPPLPPPATTTTTTTTTTGEKKL